MEDVHLSDFLPYYPDFDPQFDTPEFSVYPYGPDDALYLKKEFYNNRLERNEKKPDKPGVPLKHQKNLATLMSALTLNDSIFLFDGLGSGKCVHPSTVVRVNGMDQTMEDVWKRYSTTIVTKQDENGIGGDWTIPIIPLSVSSCISEPGTIYPISHSSKIKHLYRQFVAEQLFIIRLYSGKTITCTAKHKLYRTNGSWTEAKSLFPGDKVYSLSTSDRIGENRMIEDSVHVIQCYFYTGFVYDFEVEGVHNYIANSILTHNTCTSITLAEEIRKSIPSMKKAIVIVPGPGLRQNFRNELQFKCTSGEYIPANYKNLTQHEKATHTTRLIGKNYIIETLFVFASELSKMTDEMILSEYSNRVFIFDEAHRIREASSEDTSILIYDQIWRLLHIVKNCKTILMSATPMRDQAYEIANVLNLILPENNQLPNGKEFMDKYFENGKLIQKKKLAKYMRGIVRYIKPMESDVIKRFAGGLYDGMSRLNVYISEMSEFQHKHYMNAFMLDTTSDDATNTDEFGAKSIYLRSRQAILFVFPDGSYGSEGFDKYMLPERNEDGVIKRYYPSKQFISAMTNDGKLKTPREILNNIKNFSSIYYSTIKEILDHPDENTFVYNSSVKGSGCLVFCELLKLVGLEKSIGVENGVINGGNIQLDDDGNIIQEKDSGKKKFSLIIGDENSVTQVDRILDKVFNTPENKYGKRIQVIVGSQVIAEGRTLKNIRMIHIQTAHWNNSMTEQTIGRGIRSFSHDDLKKEEQHVTIFRHASVYKDEYSKSISMIMYKLSEKKEMSIKQIERLVKESDVQCMLNRERNTNPNNKDYSRECEYGLCEYKCRFSTIGEVKPEDIISDTYSLFLDTKPKAFQNVLSKLFRYTFYMRFEDIRVQFSDMTVQELLYCLDSIISENMVFRNKYGFSSYLREYKNVYFLVDSIRVTNNLDMVFYTQHPTIQSGKKIDEILLENTYKYSLDDRISLISKLNPESDLDAAIIEEQVNSFPDNITQTFIELSYQGDTPLSKFIRKMYSKSILSIEKDGYEYVILNFKRTLKYIKYPSGYSGVKEWKHATPEITRMYNSHISDGDAMIKNNPYGYYGIAKRGDKAKFKLFDINKAKTALKMSKHPGQVCSTITPVSAIIDIIMNINKKGFEIIQKHDSPLSTQEMKHSLIFSKNVEKEYLAGLTDEQIRFVYLLYTGMRKTDMCKLIQSWLEKKNLMTYE